MSKSSLKKMEMLKNNLPDQELSDGLKILNRAKMGLTGQNKVWLAQNVIYTSLLTNNYISIELTSKSISEEIMITEREGIQPDFSFHQHGPQQQFGNYGLAFATDMCNWANFFAGTPFSFDQPKIENLRNYLLNGLKWVVWKDIFDISACGRQLFPNTQTEKARMLAGVYKTFSKVDTLLKTQYGAALDNFEGNIHFWRSDMTIHRRTGFYSSVRMASNRVVGAESWFFFDDAIICLGAGIKTNQNKIVATTVNQSFLKGEVLISQNGKSSVLNMGMHKFQKVNWVIHDNWGYSFPGMAKLNIENETRTGAWSYVMGPMSDKLINTTIFQLWFDHGTRPQNGSYSYIVLPGASPDNIEKLAAEFEIISNTEEQQSVKSKNGAISGIVFYQKGSDNDIGYAPKRG